MSTSRSAPINPSRSSRARLSIVAGQLAVALDGISQDEWLVLHDIGPSSFERAFLVIVESVPLREHDVTRRFELDRDITAEGYIRSYLRWFDTRRLQIIPYSNRVGATTMRWRAPGSNRTHTFPSREVVLRHRFRHMSVKCFDADMEAEPCFDVPFLRSTDERYWCNRVLPHVRLVLEGPRVWSSTIPVDLEDWQGPRHERIFINPLRHGRYFDTEVRIRRLHGLFCSHHNTEFWEVPATVSALALPLLSPLEFQREVSRILLVPTPRTYVYFGRYFCHLDHNAHFIRPMRTTFGNAHVREQLGILADTERNRDVFLSFVSRAFHGIPYLELGDPALTCEWGSFIGVLVQLPNWALAWANSYAPVVLTGSGIQFHLVLLALESSRLIDWQHYHGDQLLELTGPFFRYDPFTGKVDDLPARRAGDRCHIDLDPSRVRFLLGATVSCLRSLVDVTEFVRDRYGADLLRDDLEVDRTVLRDSAPTSNEIHEYRDYPFGRDWIGTNGGGDGLLVVDVERVVPPATVSPPPNPIPTHSVSPNIPPAENTSSVVPPGLLLSLPSLKRPPPNVFPSASSNVSLVERKRIEGEYRGVLEISILLPMRASLVAHNIVPSGQSVESSLQNLEWIPRIYEQLLQAFTDAYRTGSSDRRELDTLRTSHESLRVHVAGLESSSAESSATINRLEVDNAQLQRNAVDMEGRVKVVGQLENTIVTLEARARESSDRIAQLERELEISNGTVRDANAATDAARLGYRRTVVGALSRGDEFFARIMREVTASWQEFAHDVSVARIATAAQDPGLVPYAAANSGSNVPFRFPGANPNGPNGTRSPDASSSSNGPRSPGS